MVEIESFDCFINQFFPVLPMTDGRKFFSIFFFGGSLHLLSPPISTSSLENRSSFEQGSISSGMPFLEDSNRMLSNQRSNLGNSKRKKDHCWHILTFSTWTVCRFALRFVPYRFRSCYTVYLLCLPFQSLWIVGCSGEWFQTTVGHPSSTFSFKHVLKSLF